MDSVKFDPIETAAKAISEYTADVMKAYDLSDSDADKIYEFQLVMCHAIKAAKFTDAEVRRLLAPALATMLKGEMSLRASHDALAKI